MLFILNFKYVHFLSYPRTTYLCKHPVRFSLVDRRGFDSRFLIPFIITFILTSYIRRITLHCYHIYSFPSESWSFSRVMDIPNWRLNSTDSIATEFQSEEGNQVNQRTVVREQIDSPRSRESVRLKSQPVREFRADRPFHPQRKLRENIRMNCRTFLLDIKAVHSFQDHHCEH
jgi:hypothetical protein